MIRPVGQVTRGTTGNNRLRRFDRWIAHLVAAQIRSAPAPLAVDLGFGTAPVTTLQWQHRLQAINSATEVVGVEIDQSRVEAARGIIPVIHGGFEIPTTRRPQVIRAANVLRQYPPDEVEPAWQVMAARLTADGWLVEGTCDEQGRLASMLSIGADARPAWLTVSCRLAALQHPSQVAARLPKALIHSNVPGTPVHHLLKDMDRAWHAAPRWGARQRWIAMAESLRVQGWAVRDGPSRWRLGELTVPWEQVSDA